MRSRPTSGPQHQTQISVITLMKAAGKALAIEEIAAGVRLAPVPLAGDLTPAAARAVLASLRAVPTRGGAIGLVDAVDGDRWILHDV